VLYTVNSNHWYLSDHQQKARDHIDSSNSQDISKQQEERASASLAKRVAVDGCQDIFMLVQKLHALLQAPQAA
jgi:hypothetical protein